MPQQLGKVLAGDLITANFINHLVDEILSLQGRVALLESNAGPATNAVVITGLVPPSGVLKVGDEIQIIGRNFGFTSGAMMVYVADTRITSFKSASDELIVFNIPNTFNNIPEGGLPVQLTVSNLATTAQRTLMLESPMTLAGAVDVIPQGVKPLNGSKTPTAGSSFTLILRLRSRANLGANFALNSTVTVQGGATWVKQFLNEDETAVGGGGVHLAPSQERNVLLRIQIPPGANNTPFTVVATATAGGLTGSSGVQEYTVGVAPPDPDTTFSLDFSNASGLLAGTNPPNSVTATDITLASGAAAKVVLSCGFTMPGNYFITAALSQGMIGWEATGISGTPSSPPVSSPNNFLPITQEMINASSSVPKTAPATLEFRVRPLVGQSPSTTGSVEFKVQRSGSTTFRTTKMKLTLA